MVRIEQICPKRISIFQNSRKLMKEQQLKVQIEAGAETPLEALLLFFFPVKRISIIFAF